MNLIPKIAELLGVEIEEAFKLSEYAGIKHKFTETGLFYEDSDGKWKLDSYTTFMDLLLGRYEAFKLPFEPKKGEKYFAVSVVDKTVWPYIWDGHTGDFCYKACGNCFRTEAEAEAHKFEIYEKLTGKKWEE